MKTRGPASYVCVLTAAFLLLLIVPALAANKSSHPIVIQPDKVGVSQPLSEIAKTAGHPQFHGWIVRKEHEARRQPFTEFNIADPVVQDGSIEPDTSPITIGLNFDGMNGQQAGGVIPPDTNGAVGDKQFFLITNFAFNIYDKTTGALQVGPLFIHTIWNGFGGQCGTEDGGDPIVLFDHMANRWVVEQLEYFSSNQVCIAVSQTDDATGKYNLYAFTWPGGGLPDYPHMSVWPDGYYIAVNYFGSGQGQPCAFDRNAMLGGNKAQLVCFNPSNTDFGYLPSDLDGATLPPTGAPNHYIELGNSNTTLKEYDFHVDFNNPKNSTFTGPNTITVPAYKTLCGGGGGACIPEPHGGGLLDALGDRMMYRNAYRNFGDHESMVFTHGVGGSAKAVAAERWYELRATPVGGSFALYQAGTFKKGAGNNLWLGSVAMDKMGDMAMGFSIDNATSMDPSIWIAGRKPTDKLNKLEKPLVVHTGTQVQGNVNRWGDYSSMSVDPTDDCTFWYTQEYSNGGFNWQSHAVSFKFAGCQ